MLEQYQDRKICVAYPSPEHTGYRFNIAIMELMMQNAAMIPIRMMNAVGSSNVHNRTVLVEQCKRLGITDILWVDTDAVFPINGLLRLLRHDKDIIGVTNAARRGDMAKPAAPEPVNGVVPMSIIGFPFMLTKMKVFDAMEKPYFAEPPRWMCPEINLREDVLVSEDEFFCHFARKAGFEIWCDLPLSMEIGHVRTDVAYLKSEMLIKPNVDIDLGAAVPDAA